MTLWTILGGVGSSDEANVAPQPATTYFPVHDSAASAKPFLRTTEEDAFSLYHDYTFKLDFNIHKGQQKFKEGSTIKTTNDKIIIEVRPYYVDNLENKGGSSNTKDLFGRRAKGECNVRKKSIVEIMCNQEKGKRKSALMHASRIKMTVQLSMNNEALWRLVNAPSSECQISLGIFNSNDVEPLRYKFFITKSGYCRNLSHSLSVATQDGRVTAQAPDFTGTNVYHTTPHTAKSVTRHGLPKYKLTTIRALAPSVMLVI
ncbi:hypothetical protein M9H77_07198 [Catharanthus roseus]|uniref:Uncharacterized protein n=1 Tax=Catharanthus roseus TaxID=4058 RepID=A0ACC0BUJ9_CATRO|nr:hypothetical protein M9H77_07198 [Catharanthus roseus]